MSRRPARFTEAEAKRAGKVAAALGEPWIVRIEDGVIEIVRKDSGEKAKPEKVTVEPEPEIVL
jgi:hypothetical protein